MGCCIVRNLVLTLLLALATLASGHCRGFEDSLAQRVRACTACHGEQGRAGPDGYYPRLAGKPAGYLYNQLQNFRSQRRHYALMEGLIEPLSDAYLVDIAQHFAALDLPYAEPLPSTASASVLARGEALATRGDPGQGIPACRQCHGTALTGVLPSTPGLLGLPRDYLTAQLGGWKTGQRRSQTPDCMAQIARRLANTDVNAVTAWLSAQRVPQPAHPARTRPPLPPGASAIQCGSAPLGDSAPVTAKTVPAASASVLPAGAPIVARGAYLARIGNCALCHTAPGGDSYGGGRSIATPFGAVVSSNITPDDNFGIGLWSSQDFWNALHHGVSRDGRWLNPAFPYTSFTHITRADSDALYAYLRSVTRSNHAPGIHHLRWPYGTQWALGVWRTLFFRAADAPPDGLAPDADPLQRGAYLVEGLGHCRECHAARNALGGRRQDGAALGSTLAGSPWYAPSLHDPAQGSVAQWPLRDITALLTRGVSAQASVSGPMAEVVLHGTQYLSDDDALAMARYLQSLPRASSAPPTPAAPDADAMAAWSAQGKELYEHHCADCHGSTGQGEPGAYPALARNRAVTLANSNNLVLTVLYGGFAPATTSHPRPFGMPPFVLQLSEREVAQVLSYIRSAWGNAAPPVSEFDVDRVRSLRSR